MLIDREKFDAARGRIERSQAWVARKAGISRQALQHYLDGTQPVPPARYPRIAAALGTTDFIKSDEREAVAA